MFSFPLFSASKSQARSGSASSGSSADGTQRVWEVDPLNKSEDPVLRALGLLVSYYAHQRTTTLHFEPWLKHGCAIFVQEGSEVQETVGVLLTANHCLLKPLIKDICGLGDYCAGGSGALFVRGHKFSLIANTLPSPWGERLLLDARHDGDVLSDPASVFPWIADYEHFVAREAANDMLERFSTMSEEQGEPFRQWLTRKLRPPSRATERRVEILVDSFEREKDFARRLLYSSLLGATREGFTQARLVASDDIIDDFGQCWIDQGDTSWSAPVSWSVGHAAVRLRQVIAESESRYPAEVEVDDGAAGIAFSVDGHPLDATLKQKRVQDVSWGRLPSDVVENISPTATVFDITIHDDSPDPPHWERNRRLTEERKSAEGEDPPSEVEKSILVWSTNECVEVQPPSRNWCGWLRGRIGGMGRAQAGDMTLEDAQEVASLLKAKHYQKAMAQALPFKSGGPEVAIGIVPPCILGLLEMLLGRYSEARASICDYQGHAGEDLFSTLLLAECCERLGDTEATQDAIRRASELSSKSVSRLVENGELLEEHSFLKQAALLYELSLKQDAIEIHSKLALENERKYKPCSHDAVPRRLAWRYAQIAAEHAVAADEIDTYLMPTLYGSTLEKKTREHGGLYWQDIEQPDGRRIRQYFPNYLNRFADNFRADPTAVRKLGPVLKQMGRADEAAVFLFEALLGL